MKTRPIKMLVLFVVVISLFVVPVVLAAHAIGGADVKVTNDNNNVDGGTPNPGFDAQNRQSNETSGSTASPAAAKALVASVVAQVARFVSIGQEPSPRTELTRNATPSRTIGWSACAVPARLITTKLVSGAASRKPPLAGCIRSTMASVGCTALRRNHRTIGLRGGRWPNLAWPIATRAGIA